MGEIITSLCTHDDSLELLFTQEQIIKRVAELGKEITRDYAQNSKGIELVVIGVLNGSVVFFGDLIKTIDFPMTIDFTQSSSYGDGNGDATTSNGNPIIKRDITTPVEGKNILFIEDIVDTGITGIKLITDLEKEKPNSIKLCTLFDKPSRRKVTLTPDYVGFEIPDVFVVGYGLDYDGLGRNLPCIAKVKHPEKNPFRRT